ncbi:methyltransferase domain-containing protein [Flavobacteriaceae bacterium PRS1]|nr:methyltransferase domain-containing protein [Flavobacteriaceae bacterium PRS1]
MSSNPFHFKQFTINQDQCAMKIGTDAVLLGAWANLEHHPNSVLDIGAGTGVIALMLAQRSNEETIDAIEIDENAYEQCVGNFENSPWSDRLFCYHASLEEFTDEIDYKYDLIISNPPFYSPTLASPSLPKGENIMSNSRKIARFYDALPFEHLVESVSKLLSDEGKFSVIIPFKEEENFIELASNINLFPNRITRVKGSPTSEIKRSLMEFSFNKNDLKINELIIEVERHQYTQDYINLTKDFYLKM